jgi:site-specific recombinase XerD
MNVIHHKTKQAHIQVLFKNAIFKLKKLKPEIELVFSKYQFKHLFGREEPMHKKSIVKLINDDLRTTCEIANIPFNIKSHSFRINMVSSLLKNTSVQNVAQIIGHNDIKSTMSYQRHALSKDEIQKLLENIENKK